jgi:hypothetical protein
MTIEAVSSTRTELRRLINGYQVTQALYVLTALRIPDLLVGGPRSAEDLADAVGASIEPLYRVMRAVAALGVLEELAGRRFQLTELGEGLRSDAPGSQAGWAEMVGRPYHWAAWARALDAVRTGEHAFRLEHGTDVWTYRRDHPEETPIFNRAMNSNSTLVATTIASAYDFSRFGTVVDVGAGGGALIVGVLAHHPTVQGVFFDQPHVVADAAPYIEQSGVADRCRIVEGNFFEGVEPGGDAYMIKSVLHDWYDEDAIRILECCRAAMRPDSVLLVIERVIGPPNEDRDGKFLDLLMFVSAGGQERTADQWRALLRSGGFDMGSIIPAGPLNIIEATPA